MPPPPTRTVHYGEVAAYLLKEGGGLYQIAPDAVSALQLGRYGSGTDKRYVADGAWTREGWQLVNVHLIHVVGWLCFKGRQRNVPSAPLRQMGKLELDGERKEVSYGQEMGVWVGVVFPLAAVMQSHTSCKLFRKHSTSTQPKDRLHSTRSGRIAKPAAAKPSTPSLTALLSSVISDATQNASVSSSSARPRLSLQRQAPSHNFKTSTKKRFNK
ncbi:hypothetical protein AAVH_13703 [Aphelenchoides avenae]|nr:hypothetical protein AAVH_13703 [Aphelenchus avenae]